MPRPRSRPRTVALGAMTAVALVVGGCGSDGDGGGAGPAPRLDGAAGRGQAFAQEKGCVNCHSSTGEQRTGPTWKGIWGTDVELTDGRTVTVDRAYVETSVRDPAADVVDGYQTVMPTFDLTDGEIDDLVAYLEAIGPGS